MKYFLPMHALTKILIILFNNKDLNKLIINSMPQLFKKFLSNIVKILKDTGDRNELIFSCSLKAAE